VSKRRAALSARASSLPLCLLVVLAVSACTSAESDEAASDETVLGNAHKSCLEFDEMRAESDDSFFDDSVRSDDKVIRFADHYELADGGHTLIIETEDDEDLEGLLAYQCILDELDTSERVRSSIETTTSLMGRQSSTDGELTYEYAYHPDNGLNVLITDKD
jgi:hypothetical protein